MHHKCQDSEAEIISNSEIGTGVALSRYLVSFSIFVFNSYSNKNPQTNKLVIVFVSELTFQIYSYSYLLQNLSLEFPQIRYACPDSEFSDSFAVGN